ncbi:hypothetical protein NCAS_0A07750 [Naumovozyma castellii]|uniref:Cell wall protein CWP1 n=1 Tax=Naumovozyma castellii TaxID=27288 RepID=G0V785_NAUCA|nr:hypothetical protein NCAS_0A07750 [Naumovozyma castellii CBS 4309]CCC67333.1 hypothetical protein NCAS_0A07750 [Naumovozyma castellii CBS 4309]
MQFSTAFTIALAALASMVVADSESFGMITIHSGTNLQYAHVYADNGNLLVGNSGDFFTATVTDAGKLKLSDDKYAIAQDDGTFKEGSETDGSTGFAVSKGRLTYKNSDGFFAYPIDASSYTLSIKSSDSATGIAVSARSQTDGSTIPDFTPSGSSADASVVTSSVAVTKSVTSTTSVAVAKSATVAAISQITDGQVQATVSQQTENGAAKNLAGLSAFAAAAAMLL